MRVKHLRIRNFTSLIDVELTDLPDFVVLIGKNSSGKSNLLDALALLFTEFGTDIATALGDPNDFQHLFHGHDIGVDPPPEIAAALTLTGREWARILSIDEDVARTLETSELRIAKRVVNTGGVLEWRTYSISGETGTESFEIVMNGALVPREDSLIPGPIDAGTQEILNQLGALMDSSFRVLHTTENPRSWSNRFAERPTIIDGGDVDRLWELSQSKGNQRQTWTRTVRQYSRIAPNTQRPEGVASSIQMEEGNLSVPIGMTGEGSQAVLRLISELERVPAVVAIEEPETHLHPALIKQVGRLLTQTAERDKQLFISTHSPFLIDQTSLDSFFIVRNGGSGTQVSPMRDNRDLQGFLLDMGMRPSDILFCDAILLVEGLADEIFFNALSNKVDASLTSRHVKTIRANGASRGKYKVEFWAEAGRDAGIPLYLILDGDARAEAESAVGRGLVAPHRSLILDKGALEDCYPWRPLRQALLSRFNKEIDEPIPVGERVKVLRDLLRGQGPRNRWKTVLAEEVAQAVTREEAESEMPELVAFLRGVYYDMDM